MVAASKALPFLGLRCDRRDQQEQTPGTYLPHHVNQRATIWRANSGAASRADATGCAAENGRYGAFAALGRDGQN
jgi:hypothetical protein